MDFETALPRLVMAYRKGELVPFLGAGMSRPACTGWPEFVAGLEQQAGLPPATVQPDGDKPSPPSPSELTRRADRAVQILSNRGGDGLRRACAAALQPTGGDDQPPEPPPQTVKLAAVPWRLVLTTNYDDWYVASALEQPEILGRSMRDCHQVLASLDASRAPILWALQGFLGGQSRRPDHHLSSGRRSELAGQLVVGHEHYQRVMHNEPHFRRAFAEVFRRRSFLFLGSGLQEDYLMNLFGEIIVTYGASSLPHFALLQVDEGQPYADFLLRRLNVSLITYKDHGELPELLEELGHAVAHPRIFQGAGARVEQRFSLREGYAAQFIVRRGDLPLPGEDECSAVSASRSKRRGVHVGKGSECYFAKAYKAEILPHQLEEMPWQPCDDGRLAYQAGKSPIFAVVARGDESGKNPKRRDLRLVAPAVTALLQAAAAQHKRVVHLELPAAGKKHAWDPMWSLIETARGVRGFARDQLNHCPSVVLYIDDHQLSALSALLQGTLHIDELLACDDLRFWAIIARGGGQDERILLVRGEEDTIDDIAKLLGVPDQGWSVQTLPRPFRDAKSEPLTQVEGQTLEDFGVIHGSTLMFTPTPGAPPGGTAPSS